MPQQKASIPEPEGHDTAAKSIKTEARGLQRGRLKQQRRS
jgi:hypothetical protein